jgi:translation initiation factor IF-2
MADNDKKETGKLTLSGKGTLSLNKPVGAAPRQGVAISRSSKAVAVEVKKKRGAQADALKGDDADHGDPRLSSAEREARTRALQQAQHAPKESSATTYQTKLVVKNAVEEAAPEAAAAPAAKPSADTLREQEMAKLQKINEADAADRKQRENARPTGIPGRAGPLPTEEDGYSVRRPGAGGARKPGAGREEEADTGSIADEINKRRGSVSRYGERRGKSSGKMSVHQVMNDGFEDRDSKSPSLASQRRRRAHMKAKMQQSSMPQTKQYREVIVPEFITVQELANRMTERVGDVVKKLMLMGIMATPHQNIDADTAELIIHEFGHTLKRVSESDVENAILGIEDAMTNTWSRARRL